ncbi:MAG: hypothetical protein U0269_23035 [Polyangiales bacterium]
MHSDEAPRERQPPDEDADREAILQRRRRFVTSALATVMVASCEQFSPFRPCLEVPPSRADVEVPVTIPPCLTPVAPDVIEPSAERDASETPRDAADDARDERARATHERSGRSTVAPHRSCLTPVRHREVAPMVCLFYKRASDEDQDD